MGHHPAPDPREPSRQAPAGRHARGAQLHPLPDPLRLPAGHAPPYDLLPKSTVYDYFAQWRDDGTWQKILDALRQRVRIAVGKEPSPRAGSIDSQTIKATQAAEDRGDDGGKKINGRKRHIIVDTLGLVLVVLVTVASADDGTTASEVLSRLTAEPLRRLEVLWGDNKDRNDHLDGYLKRAGVKYRIEIVGGPAGSVGFVPLPWRWTVEQTFAWLGRYRRNSPGTTSGMSIPARQ